MDGKKPSMKKENDVVHGCTAKYKAQKSMEKKGEKPKEKKEDESIIGWRVQMIGLKEDQDMNGKEGFVDEKHDVCTCKAPEICTCNGRWKGRVSTEGLPTRWVVLVDNMKKPISVKWENMHLLHAPDAGHTGEEMSWKWNSYTTTEEEYLADVAACLAEYDERRGGDPGQKDVKKSESSAVVRVIPRHGTSQDLYLKKNHIKEEAEPPTVWHLEGRPVSNVPGAFHGAVPGAFLVRPVSNVPGAVESPSTGTAVVPPVPVQASDVAMADTRPPQVLTRKSNAVAAMTQKLRDMKQSEEATGTAKEQAAASYRPATPVEEEKETATKKLEQLKKYWKEQAAASYRPATRVEAEKETAAAEKKEQLTKKLEQLKEEINDVQPVEKKKEKPATSRIQQPTEEPTAKKRRRRTPAVIADHELGGVGWRLAHTPTGESATEEEEVTRTMEKKIEEKKKEEESESYYTYSYSSSSSSSE